jgi:glycosyltransferase involved in cell wall biosynthesis
MAMVLKRHARHWHRQEAFDVVLGFPMIPDAEAAAAIADDLHLPLATLAIGSDVMVYPQHMPALWRRLSGILAKADLAVGVCESIRKKLAEIGKCKRDPLCVYLGREREEFSPAKDKSKVRQDLGWSEDDIVGVYAGRISDTKGIGELTKAAEELFVKYPKFKLVCIGDGPAMERLIQLEANIGRSEAIVLPGQVAPEKVSVFLRGSDFMVFPSHSEGMPQAVLEAMDCGLAVVATNVGGIPEAVIDGQTGILIDAKDVNQLQAAMEKMICDRKFRMSAGDKALCVARKKFDAESNAEKFANALRSLVE